MTCENVDIPRTHTVKLCLCGTPPASAAAPVVPGVGLGEHAGFSVGAVYVPERQAGVPARKTEKRRHHFFEGLLLRIAQVRFSCTPRLRAVLCGWGVVRLPDFFSGTIPLGVSRIMCMYVFVQTICVALVLFQRLLVGIRILRFGDADLVQ